MNPFIRCIAFAAITLAAVACTDDRHSLTAPPGTLAAARRSLSRGIGLGDCGRRRLLR